MTGQGIEKNSAFSNLVNCVFANWSPRIGDPGAMGWLTVAAYFFASILAIAVCFKRRGRERFFWVFLSILLIALGVNKQLDLQSALTAAGRCLARFQGWYEERQAFQIRFIFSIIGVSILTTLFLFWKMRRYLGRIWLAFFGLGFLAAFVIIRAAGFHHFDRFINYQVGDLKVNWVFELGGIGMISVNALYLLSFGPRRADRSGNK